MHFAVDPSLGGLPLVSLSSSDGGVCGLAGDGGLNCFWVYLVAGAHVYVLACFHFFFNDTATTEIYTLSLHDALPIFTSVVTIQTTVVKPTADLVVGVSGPSSV